PRRGAHEERCPERQQHQDQQQSRNALRRIRDEVSDRKAEYERQNSDGDRDQQRSSEYLQIERLLRRTPCNLVVRGALEIERSQDRKSTRLNSSHVKISYA